jgi:hypothetical protein
MNVLQNASVGRAVAACCIAPQVDKCHAERELFRAQKQAKGWSEDRIYDAVHKLKQKQQRQEDTFSWARKHFFEMGGIDYNAVRFLNNLIRVSSILNSRQASSVLLYFRQASGADSTVCQRGQRKEEP